MNDPCRVFIALWPDETTRAALDQQAQRLDGPGRPVPTAHLHLTLAFAGTIPTTQAQCIAQRLDTLGGEALSIVLDRLGYFEGARVSWIGPAETSPALEDLAGQARGLVRACGAPIEERAFRPHVTLRRFARQPGREQPESPIHWHADEVALIESGQGGIPGRYRVLARTRLSS